MIKNITKIATLSMIIALFSSCATVQVAKFTSIDNVIDLKVNSTLPEVIAALGSKPYNVYSNQKDGYTIYLYKYKLVERKADPLTVNERGGETNGKEVYSGKEHNLFLLFKEGKLESYITSSGRKDSNPLIMFNNTLYTISSDKGKYIILPQTLDEVPTETALPFGKMK